MTLFWTSVWHIHADTDTAVLYKLLGEIPRLNTAHCPLTWK